AIVGGDESGVLYGALELIDRYKRGPVDQRNLRIDDAPVMSLRGVCIGMQKTYILPGRKVYEYPYTPEEFPFFYDKQFWIEYLDLLASQRQNTLYLWNGHPFASLVRVPDYPYAVEVSDEVFRMNEEMFEFITTEADKRGIWIVQMFYSLLVSKPFAEHHGISTQLAEGTPEALDYTRKSIAAFVAKYPHVGLLICLGEAMTDLQRQKELLTDYILPGVHDGMKAAGLTEEPPVVLRAHATNPSVVVPAALEVYKNLYTMAKFNGESLTTWEPRGVRQRVHLGMSELGSKHISNVHILANLEPFRYSAQRFIKKSVQASRDRLGAQGMHVYPLAYWAWPDTPDNVEPRLRQHHRDWMWFEAWARYAWNPDIDEAVDRAYWIERLTSQFGNAEAAAHVLDAVNDAGEVAPRILRRFGITEGNRQTMSLGMTLDQLVNPERYRPYPELWESQSPPGERLHEYAERAWKKEPHEGETPPQIVEEVLAFSKAAVEAIDRAAPLVAADRAEFDRLRNDILCIRAMAQDYAEKVRAAMLVLRHRYSNDLTDLKAAEKHLAASLEHFRELERLTRDTYLFANTMQTSQRRIPVVGGVDGKAAYYHWTQVLPIYEAELADLRKRIADIEAGRTGEDESQIQRLQRAAFTIHTPGAEQFEVMIGSRVFTDRDVAIRSVAPELVGLRSIRFSHAAAVDGTMPPVEFEVTEPVQVLGAYMQDADPQWLKPADLETDALAGAHGGNEPIIFNAATISELPAMHVHVFDYPAGRHKMDLRGKGSFVILGITTSTDIHPRDAGRSPGANDP
ncbi:MAG TPA: hypothetical protein PKB10_10180, partial [Tepidisphaeraceae bacterium]|nr:hypothetical protein [Tepidisphaeraceae bacterium]